MPKEDKCPKCDSEKLEYGVMEQTGMGNIYYPVECKECGFEGKQWYDVTFSGYTDENGDDVNENANRRIPQIKE